MLNACTFGLPMPLLAVVRWPAVAIFLAGLTGMGALLVEILTETGLQRSLDDAVFGAAYGLMRPASLGGILVGSLAAPLLTSRFGGSGAPIIAGAVALGYALLLLRKTRQLPSAASSPARQAPDAAALEARLSQDWGCPDSLTMSCQVQPAALRAVT